MLCFLYFLYLKLGKFCWLHNNAIAQFHHILITVYYREHGGGDTLAERPISCLPYRLNMLALEMS